MGFTLTCGIWKWACALILRLCRRRSRPRLGLRVGLAAMSSPSPPRRHLVAGRRSGLRVGSAAL
eukprot:8976011-Pyramimonas_sp.AAC.1